jgi:hypothetical protein
MSENKMKLLQELVEINEGSSHISKWLKGYYSALKKQDSEPKEDADDDFKNGYMSGRADIKLAKGTK